MVGDHRLAKPPPSTSIPRAEWIGRQEALRILPVKPATLYTYVSRGMVRRQKRPGERQSLFSIHDLERLRAQSDAHASNAQRAVAALHWGEPSIATTITELGPDGPRYRRRHAVELAAEGASFEQVCSLLWTGAQDGGPAVWPARDQTAVAAAVEALVRSAPAPDLMKLLASAALMASLVNGHRTELVDRSTVASAQALIQVLTGVCGFIGPGCGYEPTRPGQSVAATLTRALGLEATQGARARIDAALVVCADHELAPATFTARVAASAGADLYACIAAGISAHSGAVVGQACGNAETLLADLAGRRERREKLELIRSRGGRLFGFDHPLYPGGDPLGQYLIGLARAVSPLPEPAARAIAFLAEAAEAGSHAGMGTGLVVLAMALEAPLRSALAIWTVGRSAGLAAHVIEQRQADFLLRPRAHFLDLDP
jgi:citrate synthase